MPCKVITMNVNINRKQIKQFSEVKPFDTYSGIKCNKEAKVSIEYLHRRKPMPNIHISMHNHSNRESLLGRN